jgi:hypothetical protein
VSSTPNQNARLLKKKKRIPPQSQERTQSKRRRSPFLQSKKDQFARCNFTYVRNEFSSRTISPRELIFFCSAKKMSSPLALCSLWLCGESSSFTRVSSTPNQNVHLLKKKKRIPPQSQERAQSRKRGIFFCYFCRELKNFANAGSLRKGSKKELASASARLMPCSTAACNQPIDDLASLS